jgi:tellurite resistance protein
MRPAAWSSTSTAGPDEGLHRLILWYTRLQAFMEMEEKINLLAKVAGKSPSDGGAQPVSILTLAAASYGARPSDEATVPTGFDPQACALFESIVEGAYLVASADGVIDDEERKTFEKVVTTACGGTVAPPAVHALVADLADQLQEDGIDRRVEAIAQQAHRPEHCREVLRIAALVAQVSDSVSEVERAVLVKIAKACGLPSEDVDRALEDVKSALNAEKS